MFEDGGVARAPGSLTNFESDKDALKQLMVKLELVGIMQIY